MAPTTARRGKPTKPASRLSRDEPARKKMRQTTLPNAVSISTSEDDTPDTKDHKRKLLLSMDYGTKTLSIAARVASSDNSANVTQFDIFDVRFFKRSYEAEQILAFGGEDNKRFFWGSDVRKALKQGEVRPENVIQLWKLMLYKDYNVSATVRHLQAQIDRLNVRIVGLITTHLKAVIKYAKQNIANGVLGMVEDIDTLPLELFLSVPQLWKSPASRQMAIAAKKAGIERVELVREPECAAAFYTHTIKDQLPTGHEIGNELIICDIGGGTGDFLRVRYDSEYTDGAKVRLKNTGDAAGALCGSEFVNEHFREWLKEQARRETKTFKAMCAQLGISETACLKAASDEFESIKRDFTMSEGGSSEYITLRGAQGAARSRWELDLTTADIRSFFDPVISKIKQCIDKQRTDKTKTILIPGGFGCSDYLRAQLQAYYKPHGINIGSTCTLSGSDCPVSRGALLRYDEIRARGFDPNESFGLAQIEEYDENVHRDASHENENVKVDPYIGSFIVYERWRSISKRSDPREPGQTFQSDTWQQSIIHAAQKVLNVQVYWTELDVKDHDPIRDGATADSPLRDGIESWGPPLEIRLPDLKELGFKAIRGFGRHKGWVYEIRWRLRLVGEGANVWVEWQIAKPGTLPYKEHADLESVNMDLPEGQVFRLCEEDFNPSPRSNA